MAALARVLLVGFAALLLLAPAAAVPRLPNFYQPLIIAPGKVCGVGAVPVGTNLLSTDFDSGVPGFVLSPGSTNYWHVTGFAGQGVDVGHSGTQRLYYGVERPQGGTFNFGRTFGAITFTQPLSIPAVGETVISWMEKWQVEWGGFGIYDAMAVQLVNTPNAGFLTGFPIPDQSLCLSDAHDPIPQSLDAGTGLPSCSPSLVSPCLGQPTWMPRFLAVPDDLKGTTKYLRFQFDAMDGLYNDFLGWQIDDLRVVTLP